jgi:hypothetical protein
VGSVFFKYPWVETSPKAPEEKSMLLVLGYLKCYGIIYFTNSGRVEGGDLCCNIGSKAFFPNLII